MLLSKAIDEKEYDIRTLERNLAKGYITKQAIDKHSDSLKDEADEGQAVNLEELFEGFPLGQSSLRQG